MTKKDTLKDLEMALSGGLEPWKLTMAKIDFGPFPGFAMPTVFFMDVEYDPNFAQFDDDGYVYIFNDQGAEWVCIDAESMRNLIDMADYAVEMLLESNPDDDEEQNMSET